MHATGLVLMWHVNKNLSWLNFLLLITKWSEWTVLWKETSGHRRKKQTLKWQVWFSLKHCGFRVLNMVLGIEAKWNIPVQLFFSPQHGKKVWKPAKGGVKIIAPLVSKAKPSKHFKMLNTKFEQMFYFCVLGFVLGLDWPHWVWELSL